MGVGMALGKYVIDYSLNINYLEIKKNSVVEESVVEV